MVRDLPLASYCQSGSFRARTRQNTPFLDAMAHGKNEVMVLTFAQADGHVLGSRVARVKLVWLVWLMQLLSHEPSA